MIKNYVEDERILQFVNIAMSSTEMLMSKISDILDYSLLETNTLELKPVEFNLRNLMAHIEDILNLQFDHKMIHFSTFIADRVPTIVEYDHKRLKQILINLVYNALKYTEKGFVHVIIDCKFMNKDTLLPTTQQHYRGMKECELNISVADSG